jgi:hypothetical protein
MNLVFINGSPRVRPTDGGTLQKVVPGCTQEGVAKDTAGRKPRRLKRGGSLPHIIHSYLLLLSFFENTQ